MIKIGETSLLDLPLMLLMKAFPFVGKYYKNNPSAIDFYQHVYTGLILTLIFCWAALLYNLFIFGVPISFLIHVVWKEMIHDKKKRTTKHEREVVYPVDITTRIYGYILGFPVLLCTILFNLI